jgi:TetR/AcrR family transcriptional repressor of nem operon
VTNQDTKSRLVEAATDLFWTQGFRATSVAQILRRSGVNSGSLYYFFRGKTELLVAAVESYPDRYWRDMLEPAFDAERDPVDRLVHLFARHRADVAAQGFTRGSFLGNLSVEMADASPMAQAAIAVAWRRVQGWIKLWLVEAAPRLREETDFDALAGFLLASLEGGLMQVRAQKSLAPFDAVIVHVRFVLSALGQAAQPAENP